MESKERALVKVEQQRGGSCSRKAYSVLRHQVAKAMVANSQLGSIVSQGARSKKDSSQILQIVCCKRDSREEGS